MRSVSRVTLHRVLSERRVHRINIAREFFYCTPGEVMEQLRRIAGQHLLEYREEAEAAEWRASGSLRADQVGSPPL